MSTQNPRPAGAVDRALRQALAEIAADVMGVAPAEVRAQDLLDHPHDEACPHCGRRQWLDPNAQETCQACGFVFTGPDAMDDPDAPDAVELRRRWAEEHRTVTTQTNVYDLDSGQRIYSGPVEAHDLDTGERLQ
jgi:hypothetical protein